MKVTAHKDPRNGKFYYKIDTGQGANVISPSNYDSKGDAKKAGDSHVKKGKP